jgi:hypothetical protein
MHLLPERIRKIKRCLKNNQTPIEKIAAKKPDCVRADVFEFCLIIGDLWSFSNKIAVKKIFSGVLGLIPSLNLRFLSTRGAPVPV